MNKRIWALCGAIIAVIVGFLLFWPSEKRIQSAIDSAGIIEEFVDTTELEQKHYKYGIPDEDFEVIEDVVGKNQTLSTILNKYGVSAAKIHEICERCINVFDVRKIRNGHKYTLFLAKDSVKTPEFFIYEKSSLEYVVIDFKEESEVYVGRKSVDIKEHMAKVVINSSLWNAFQEAETDPMLAVALADIYAWSIDFYGIAKGDSIRVIYEDSYVEDKALRDFRVKGAIFTNNGKDYYAIPYEQGDVAYFDEEGNSLQKSFLKAPLKYSRISSGFSNSRYHPVLKINRAHHGVDYAAPTGTPVYTIGDGVVTKRAYQANGGGNYVTIKHNSVYSTTYMHLSKFAQGIQVGKRVKQGEVIGYVGATGLATGPHLDFRVYKNGTPINPLTMESPPKEPVQEDNMEEFKQIRDSIIQTLKAI